MSLLSSPTSTAIRSLLLAFGIAVAAPACAPTVRSASSAAARGATPSAMDAALDTFEEEQTRKRLEAILASKEVQRAIAAVAESAARGATDEILAPQRIDNLTKVVAKAVRDNADEFGGATEILTRRATAAALDEALSSGREARFRQIAVGISAALMKTTADELTTTLGPALRKVIEDDIAPAMGSTIRKQLAPALQQLLTSPEVKSAVAGIVREASRQAVLGSNDGLAELAEKRAHDAKSSPLGIIGTFFSQRTWLIGALVMGAILAIPCCGSCASAVSRNATEKVPSGALIVRPQSSPRCKR